MPLISTKIFNDSSWISNNLTTTYLLLVKHYRYCHTRLPYHFLTLHLAERCWHRPNYDEIMNKLQLATSTLLVNNNNTSDFNVNKISLLEYVMLTVTLAGYWMLDSVDDKAGSTSVFARSCCAATWKIPLTYIQKDNVSPQVKQMSLPDCRAHWCVFSAFPPYASHFFNGTFKNNVLEFSVLDDPVVKLHHQQSSCRRNREMKA